MRARALLLLVVLASGCIAAPPAPDPAPSPARVVPSTARFVVSIATVGANHAVDLRVEGAYDRANDAYELAVTSTTVPVDAMPDRVVATRDAAYVEYPALARRLGASTRWLRLAEPARSAPEFAFGDLLRWLDTVVGRSDEVETGAGGLVRRAVMRFDSPANEGSVVVTVTYADEGVPVTIVPPPPSETTDVTDLLVRLVARPNGG